MKENHAQGTVFGTATADPEGTATADPEHQPPPSRQMPWKVRYVKS